MITKDQALSEDRFHEDGPQRKDGSCYAWRRNGQTQTWKTRPGEFRIPVKYGLRDYGQITDKNAAGFHTEADCPNRKKIER